MLLRIALIWVALATSASAQEARRWHGLSPFELPSFVAAEKTAEAILRTGRLAQALGAYEKLVAQYADVPRVHINHGVALALAGQQDKAIKAFETGAALGFNRFDQLNAPQLADFMALPEIEALVAAAQPLENTVIFPPAVPATPKNGELIVGEANVEYLPKSDVLLLRTQFPNRTRSRIVANSQERWAVRLNQLFGRGKAAGNHGDLYENRDGDHSLFDLKEFPQFTRMRYAPEIDAKYQLSRGVNLNVVADAVVLGNSSTAFNSGPFWRSLARHAQTSPGGARKLFTQHRANQIYIYPEVRDLEPDYDLFPGYFADQILSIGTSGSDKAPMRAAAIALAAFRPAVKAELKKRNLITPTVAAILRRAINGVEDEDITADIGHRVAIDGAEINLSRVITLAQSYTPETIPPRVVMAVEDEAPRLDPMRNGFLPLANEAIYGTPTSHARIARGTYGTRSYRLAAGIEGEGTADFTWAVLSGDAARIEIKPLDDRSQRVEVTIAWHDPFNTAEGDATNRVDIGVFVKSGTNWSSPAVFSLTFPRSEKRVYRPDGKVQGVDYSYQQGATYSDPRLEFRRDWEDKYIYQEGHLEGWERHLNGSVTRYSATGEIVTKLDEEGRPSEGTIPAYSVNQQPNGTRQVTVKPGPKRVKWQYGGPEDRTGLRVPFN